MNLTEFSLRKRTVTAILLVMLALMGVQTYFSITKKETPEFIIRTAAITTPIPRCQPRARRGADHGSAGEEDPGNLYAGLRQQRIQCRHQHRLCQHQGQRGQPSSHLG